MPAVAAAAERTYVVVVPPHSLVEWPGKKTLVVDLSGSGFRKEHLRVQIDRHGKLRVSGERHLEGSMWSSFRKDLRVPGGVRARIDKDGVLHITMPMLSSPAAAQEQRAAEEERGGGSWREAVAASTTSPPAFGMVRDRRRTARAALVAAVALAFAGAAGMYAVHRLMDPSADPAGDHVLALPDH